MASRKTSIAPYRHLPPPRFGAWLRELRQKKGLALREVAAAVEMDQAHLSKAELGQRIPTAEQAARLAGFFKLPVAQMEARRVAEKALQELESSPHGLEALSILREEPIELTPMK
jgi:HTH-type transcriptional regulator, competence development regulator